MRSTTIFSLLAVASPFFAHAQSSYVIDPKSVDQAQRDKWCADQIEQCPLICLQLPGVTSMNTVANACDPDALDYQCICENNVAPNVTEFSQTLPFYICQEWGNQCVAACGQDNSCSYDCRANHHCGASYPKRVNSTAASTMSQTAAPTPTQTGDADSTELGFAGATSAPKNGNGKSAASSWFNKPQAYGLFFAAGAFATVGLIL
ncbi:hypothetical protein GQ43DRAFT_437776 [Delitschia confertaspora ATCC 74209]|uniref:DUF7707 domain-containing protein n=1 Tax=Delitschia confertaspora ATCC 74209 TaxID=1513339 RepID=A0A9P4MYV9_9PLEO|nr:hypothetical protein GQ43DRAFT_437776 [Delitschia confertaspora ATCC 74209]